MLFFRENTAVLPRSNARRAIKRTRPKLNKQYFTDFSPEIPKYHSVYSIASLVLCQVKHLKFFYFPKDLLNPKIMLDISRISVIITHALNVAHMNMRVCWNR